VTLDQIFEYFRTKFLNPHAMIGAKTRLRKVIQTSKESLESYKVRYLEALEEAGEPDDMNAAAKFYQGLTRAGRVPFDPDIHLSVEDVSFSFEKWEATDEMLNKSDTPQSQDPKLEMNSGRQGQQSGQREPVRFHKREREIVEDDDDQCSDSDKPYTDRQSTTKVSRVTTDEVVAEMVQRQLRQLGYGTVNVQQVQSAQTHQQSQKAQAQTAGRGNQQQLPHQQTSQHTHPLVPPQTQHGVIVNTSQFPQFPQLCTVCLSPMHSTSQCPTARAVCLTCGKLGHLTSECRSRWYCTHCQMSGHDISICRRLTTGSMQGRGAATGGRGDGRGRGRGRGQSFLNNVATRPTPSCASCGGIGHNSGTCPQSMAGGGRGQGRGRNFRNQYATGSNAMPVVKQEPGLHAYQPIYVAHQPAVAAQQHMPTQQQYFQVPGQHQVQLPTPPVYPGFFQSQQLPHTLTVQQVQTNAQIAAEVEGESSGKTPTSQGEN
jgi:hypothetical protein